MTFEGGVPAEHEVYFSITDSTRFRAPTMTLTHHGGMDIEELDKSQVAHGAVRSADRPEGVRRRQCAVASSVRRRRSSRRWCSSCRSSGSSIHDFGMTTLELNPIRMREDKKGRLTPVACDFKCGFDRDDPRWQRLDLPPHLFAVDYSDFEQEINQLRTYQGQSDVYVINDEGHDPRADLRRRRQLAGDRDARRRRDHLLGLRRQSALREDEGGGAHLLQALAASRPTCCSSSAASRTTPTSSRRLRAMADALREHFSEHGPTPLYVVVGRGGPNLVRGMGALRDTCDALGLPYRLFGFDSDMSEVIQYAKRGRTRG